MQALFCKSVLTKSALLAGELEGQGRRKERSSHRCGSIYSIVVRNPVWSPSQHAMDESHMMRFLRLIASDWPEVTDYATLHRWSVAHPDLFWAAVWDFCNVQAEQSWERPTDHFPRMPGTRWFPGSRVNFASNLLKESGAQPALISWNEAGPRGRISFSELRRQVNQVALRLIDLGVDPGDRVVGFLPNIAETVIAMLATASLGAIWSSCSPDFGAQGVLDRFGQIEPKVLFAANSYCYAGKQIDLRERVRALMRQIPSIQALIAVPYLQSARIQANQLAWEEMMSAPARPFEPIAFPFDHPLYILYSSGTTGLPKCMVHGAGGTLLQHLKELILHTNLSPGERIFYYTTCGWMMWNWLVSALGAGATVFLYDGSPFHPHDAILFEMAAQEGVNVFGVSAKYLSLAEKRSVYPTQNYDLSALRTVLSTGSPLAPHSYDYVREQVGASLQLSSISGGTDLISCFALGNPILPVFRGELQSVGLGMAVQILGLDGKPTVGQAGELVCARPFPSMPVAFWNDPDGSRYRAAYFEHFPGVWRHGDWAEITPRGGLIIHGRSDATLNPGGVRIGTAEIYRQVEKLDAILESVVVVQEWEDDVRLVLFVCLSDGLQLDEELSDQIRRTIRENASTHHVPTKILQVPDIPRTVSGKISELAVRETIHGRVVSNRNALANPEALDLFADLKTLRS